MSKFCVNCKHYIHVVNDYCVLSQQQSINIVSGRINTKYRFAKDERDSRYGACGKNGDLYQHDPSSFSRFLNRHPISSIFVAVGCTIGPWIYMIM